MPGPRHIDLAAAKADPRPTLKAIILDFTAVEHVDVTAVQVLQDVRGQLDRHATPDIVEWHFAGIHRPWVKRALVAAGFGRIQTPEGLSPMYSIAKVGDASNHHHEQRAQAQREAEEKARRQRGLSGDIETTTGKDNIERAVAALPVFSIDREVSFLS